MSFKDVGLRRSIVTKLLKVVFTFYLFIAVGVTLGHMLLEYQHQKSSIRNDLYNIQRAYEEGLAVSMWQLDRESLASTFNGMMEMPIIVGVKIQDVHATDIAVGGIISDGNKIGSVGQHINLLGLSQDESQVHQDAVYKYDVFMHHFPIIYSNNDEQLVIGKASIYSNTSVILRRVQFGFILLIVNATLKTAALWVIFLLFSNILLRKPLARLVSATEDVSLENLDTYQVEVDTSGRNELKILEESFNTMIRSLHKSIQEKRQIEKSLLSSEIQYRTIFEKTNDAIFIVQGETGRYLDANAAAEVLTGRKLPELQQLTTHQVTPYQAEKRLREINEISAPAGLEVVQYIRPDGTTRTARLNIVPLDSDVVIGIARDITDEIAMENKLRQSQKMEAIGTLAGGIAHDFNNILSAIFGYTELAMGDSTNDQALQDHLEKVIAAAHRAKGLVQQILAFSRKSDMEFSPIQPVKVVEETVKMIRPTLPVTIEIIQNLESVQGHIYADPTQVSQILLNLCTNAYHAMEEKGGELEITLKEKQLSPEDVKHEPGINAGTFCQISVSDTGTGIPDELMSKIFDPYFTTKSIGKGTGLGLSMVHGLVRSYGGYISVYSEVNRGTVVHVFIPLITDETITAEFSKELTPTGTERILFVDDEEDLCSAGETMLMRLGYHVVAKTSSSEALSIFQNDPDQFDLVISDQTMPEMTGFELAERLLDLRSDIPIILCTGYSSTISEEKAKVAGIQEFAMKPLLQKDLSRLIRKVLDSEGTATASISPNRENNT